MVAIAEKEAQTKEYIAFKDFSTQQLMKKFDLKRERRTSLLQQWIDTPCEISPEIRQSLGALRDKLEIYGPFYNEAELKWKFIIPLIQLVNFEEDSEQYETFAERMISGEVQGQPMRGVVDFIVASGQFEPVSPYFFLGS